jgi:hypothetical protein
MNNESLQELLRQMDLCRDQLRGNESIVDIEVAQDILSFKVALWDGYQNHFMPVICSLTDFELCRIKLLVAIFEAMLERLRKAVDDVG